MLLIPSYNKHLPYLKSCAFVNLGEIAVLALSIIVRALTPARTCSTIWPT